MKVVRFENTGEKKKKVLLVLSLFARQTVVDETSTKVRCCFLVTHSFLVYEKLCVCRSMNERDRELDQVCVGRVNLFGVECVFSCETITWKPNGDEY